MVRVLASGEVVADDDPRAQASRRQQSGQRQARQMGQIRHDDDDAYQGGAGAMGGQGQGVSIFQVLNQKLLDAGIPRWNLGSTVIEPIVTIGFLLAMLLLGMKGLILGGILFAVVKLSGDGNDTSGGGGGRGGIGRGGSGGRTTGGRVLGGR